jgi:peptidyl-prolyl cis-trans isomerase B (cyclophilin B)
METMLNNSHSLRKRNLPAVLAVLILLLSLLAGCGAGTETNDAPQQPAAGGPTDPNNPTALIEMENGDKIEIELFPDIAPNTVNNFIALAQQGFYDGLIFHRVIPGFMIQGGDPDGTGAGGPGYSIKGEFANNQFPNELKHERGVLSMARTKNPDSAGSQFFIMAADATHLDGDYAAFGKVYSGFEAVDAIVNAPRGANDRPNEDQVMKKVTIDTKDFTYAEPDKLPAQ